MNVAHHRFTEHLSSPSGGDRGTFTYPLEIPIQLDAHKGWRVRLKKYQCSRNINLHTGDNPTLLFRLVRYNLFMDRWTFTPVEKVVIPQTFQPANPQEVIDFLKESHHWFAEGILTIEHDSNGHWLVYPTIDTKDDDGYNDYLEIKASKSISHILGFPISQTIKPSYASGWYKRYQYDCDFYDVEGDWTYMYMRAQPWRFEEQNITLERILYNGIPNNGSWEGQIMSDIIPRPRFDPLSKIAHAFVYTNLCQTPLRLISLAEI